MSIARHLLLISTALFSNFISANNLVENPNSSISINKFSAISCDQSGQLCLAVGSEKNAKISNLQIYKSQNAGIDWNAPIKLEKALFESASDTLEAQISCDSSGLACAIVRVGKIEDSLTPMTYFTKDGGLTWSGPHIIFHTTAFVKDNIHVGIKCNNDGSSCIIMSTSNKNRDISSKIYVISQNGEKWEPAAPFKKPNGAESDSYLMDIDCNNTGLYCTAVGFSNISNHFWESYHSVPVVYVTEDGGIHWHDPIASIKNELIKNKGNLLSNVSCSDTGRQCTVIGATFDSNFEQQYYSYSSNDGGLTWEGPSLFPNSTYLNSIDCGASGANCEVVGAYVYSNEIFSGLFRPIIFHTNNSGLSWKQIEEQNVFPIFSKLTDVFCSKTEEHCAYVGFQSNTEQKTLTSNRKIKLNPLAHVQNSIALGKESSQH